MEEFGYREGDILSYSVVAEYLAKPDDIAFDMHELPEEQLEYIGNYEAEIVLLPNNYNIKIKEIKIVKFELTDHLWNE